MPRRVPELRCALLLLPLMACREGASITLPEPRPGEDSRIVLLAREGAVQGWASDRANPLQLPPLALGEQRLPVAFAFYQDDLSTLRLPAGEMALEVLAEDETPSPLFSQPAPLRQEEGELSAEGLSLNAVEALRAPFDRVTVARPARRSCEGREAVIERSRPISQLTGSSTMGGTAIALARLDPERILLATRGGELLESHPELGDRLVRTSTHSFSAGVQTPDGPLRLATERGGLLRLDPLTLAMQTVIPDQGGGALTSLAGGLTERGVQLVGYQAETGDLLVYEEGATQWTRRPTRAVCTTACDFWRAAWLGPDDFVLTAYQRWLFHVQGERVRQIEIREGCESVSAVAKLSDEERLLGCLALVGQTLRTDRDWRTLDVTGGLGAFSTSVILPFDGGAVLIGGDARLAFWRPVDGPCTPTRTGAVDVAQLIQVGAWFVAINHRIDGRTMKGLEPTVMWFRFEQP